MDVCLVRTCSRWAWRRRPPRFAHTFGKNLHILSLSLCMPGVLPGSPPGRNPLHSPRLSTTVVLRATFCSQRTRSPSAIATLSLSAPTRSFPLPLLELSHSESEIVVGWHGKWDVVWLHDLLLPCLHHSRAFRDDRPTAVKPAVHQRVSNTLDGLIGFQRFVVETLSRLTL